MRLFNFGKKQRLYAKLEGRTSGREMFHVDEYNQRKKTTIGLFVVEAILATIFWFMGGDIWHFSIKTFMFLVVVFIGLGVWLYFNFKQQRRMRENLY